MKEKIFYFTCWLPPHSSKVSCFSFSIMQTSLLGSNPRAISPCHDLDKYPRNSNIIIFIVDLLLSHIIAKLSVLGLPIIKIPASAHLFGWIPFKELIDLELLSKLKTINCK